ncbi:PREDICTED: josephin-like protein [Ipomoea nil]|uniref:josephin-like protein n=1 Tax=Ipomoea nil TaxID=35883 RepID=UPI0009015212|nr:PREDICTED: josephin-like protein [Ipomoea nil]
MLAGEETIDAFHHQKQIKYTRSCSLKIPKRSELLHPIRYLKRFSGSMMEALRTITPGRCRKVASSSSSSSESGLKGSCTAAAAIYIGQHGIIGSDHRAEAIDDCIQFINSSLSLSRSNSISAC